MHKDFFVVAKGGWRREGDFVVELEGCLFLKKGGFAKEVH